MIYRGLDVFFNDSVYDGASAERSEFNVKLVEGMSAFIFSITDRRWDFIRKAITNAHFLDKKKKTCVMFSFSFFLSSFLLFFF